MPSCSCLRAFALCILVPSAAALGAQTKPLTVSAIFTDPSLTADAPRGMEWSPDGLRMTYLNDNGDLMAADGESGKTSVLVAKEKIGSMHSSNASEQDKDHRSRYGEASYLWAPDSKHLLFDSNGALFLYTLKTGLGLSIAETGTASGDDPKFAPDGSAVTYVHDHDLYLRRLPYSQTPMRLTMSRDPAVLNGEVDWLYLEELDVRSNYFWSPDSKSIAFLQMNEAAVPQYPITDWIPTHATVEMQRYPQPGDPNPGVRVGVVNVTSGHISWMKVPLAAGEDYVPRFGWLNAHTLWIETLTRDHKHRRLYFADVSNGRTRLALEETDAKFFDESYDVTISGANILWTSWRDGHTQIYLYNFNESDPMSGDAKLVRQLTHGDGEVSSIKAVDPAGRMVYYISNEGDPREQQLWSVKLDGTGRKQLTEAHGVHKPEFSPNARLYADNFSNLETPPTVAMCTVTADTCNTFWHPTLNPRVQADDAAPADAEGERWNDALRQPDAAAGRAPERHRPSDQQSLRRPACPDGRERVAGTHDALRPGAGGARLRGAARGQPRHGRARARLRAGGISQLRAHSASGPAQRDGPGAGAVSGAGCEAPGLVGMELGRHLHALCNDPLGPFQGGGCGGAGDGLAEL